MLATLIKAARAEPQRTADFKTGCGILAANFSSDVHALLTLGHALSIFAKRDELTEEERALVNDMSEALTTLGKQMLEPDSPYMKLYQLTKAASLDDASAQRLLEEAQRVMNLPAPA